MCKGTKSADGAVEWLGLSAAVLAHCPALLEYTERKVVGTEVGPAWGTWRGSPSPRQLCWQTPPVHSCGVDGAAVGQDWAALIAEASVPSLATC